MDYIRSADSLEERRWRKLLVVFHAVRRYSRAVDMRERANHKAAILAFTFLFVLLLAILFAYLGHPL
jgi:hypothetical protein